MYGKNPISFNEKYRSPKLSPLPIVKNAPIDERRRDLVSIAESLDTIRDNIQTIQTEHGDDDFKSKLFETVERMTPTEKKYFLKLLNGN